MKQSMFAKMIPRRKKVVNLGWLFGINQFLNHNKVTMSLAVTPLN